MRGDFGSEVTRVTEQVQRSVTDVENRSICPVVSGHRGQEI